jgi:hypothetical protein
MSNPTKQTIPSSYSLVMMPDGSHKAVARVLDEKGNPDWEFVENRLKAQADFEARFPENETRPQSWSGSDTEILTPKVKISPLINAKNPCTRDHINAHLVSIFGVPERVLAEGASSERIKKIVKDRRHFDTCCELMKICKDPNWVKVREMLLGEST